jgi:hypothetical protein
MNFNRGKFSIGETDAGEKVVAPDMSMVRSQKSIGTTRGNRKVISLEAFKKQVNGYLGK